MMIVLGVIVAAILFESFSRWKKSVGAPTHLRLLYAFFLTNAVGSDAINAAALRVQLTGFESFDECAAFLTREARVPQSDVPALMGVGLPWWRFCWFSRPPRLRYRLRWHVGLTPAPTQNLPGITIDGSGCRHAGASLDGPSPRTVWLLGNSVAFGEGATSDATALGARLQAHLNASSPDVCYQVRNRAFTGALSFQELVDVLQHVPTEERPDLVVSLSGWCDVDQAFESGRVHFSSVSQGYSDHQRAGSSPRGRTRRFVRRHLTSVQVIARFLRALQSGPQTQVSAQQ